MSTHPQGYDYVIVGGGSAGAIVATRLAEDSGSRVLVLEAGPENTSYWSRVPLGFAKIPVDASVLPGELTANIHPAVIGVAERAADLIKASR